ncbi:MULTISPECIES: hypothetical protein [unclassified Clostridioides]|nr:hypothetical protein [Clostridioides sp. ES-W-0018-02]MCC0705117.1 hypothetical protein [Clostridioides sp. ES-S-0049-02]MCC0713008.1 hypothetical protein [Clostridioides sp. ES-W-0017-02]
MILNLILKIAAIFNLGCMGANYLGGDANGIIVNGFCAVALLLSSNNLD